MKGGHSGDIEKNFEKKSHKADKEGGGGESHSVEKKENLLLRKKLAHTHGFEHETSGLKSKHLTTRPRARELCDLPREMRVVAQEKKAPALSDSTCLSQV